ncbi:transcriptional regulator swi6, partial [Physocladia obscura]
MQNGLDLLSSVAQTQQFQQPDIEIEAKVFEHQKTPVLPQQTAQARSLYEISSANATVDISDISDKSNGKICLEVEAKNVGENPPFESRDLALKKTSDRNLTPTKNPTNSNTTIKLGNNINENKNKNKHTSLVEPESPEPHTPTPPPFFCWANSSESPIMPVQPSIADNCGANSSQPHFATFGRNYACNNNNNASQNYAIQQLLNSDGTGAFTSSFDQQKLQLLPRPLPLSHLQSHHQTQHQHQLLMQLQAQLNNDQLKHPHRNNNDMFFFSQKHQQPDPLIYQNSQSFELLVNPPRFDISLSQKHAHFLHLQRQQLQLQHQQLMLLSSQLNNSNSTLNMNMNANCIDANNFHSSFNNTQFSPQAPNAFENSPFFIPQPPSPVLLSLASVPTSPLQIQQTQSIPTPLQLASQFLTAPPIIQSHSGSFLLSPQPQSRCVPTTQFHSSIPVSTIVKQHQQPQKQQQSQSDTSSQSSEFLCSSEYDDDNADSDDEQVMELMRAENADLLARDGDDGEDEMFIDGGVIDISCEGIVEGENLDKGDESNSDGDDDDDDDDDESSGSSSSSDASSFSGSVELPNFLNTESQCHHDENGVIGDQHEEESDKNSNDKEDEEFEVLSDVNPYSQSIANSSPIKKRKFGRKKVGQVSKLSQTLSPLLDGSNMQQYNEQELFDNSGQRHHLAMNDNDMAKPRKLKIVFSNGCHTNYNNSFTEQHAVFEDDDQNSMSFANQIIAESEKTLYSTILSTSNKRRPGRIPNMRSGSLGGSSTSITRGDTALPSSSEPLEQTPPAEPKRKRGRKPGSVVVGGKVVDVATRRRGIYGTPTATSLMPSFLTPAPYLLSATPQTEKHFYKDSTIAMALQNESIALTCPKSSSGDIESVIPTLPSRHNSNIDATAVYHAANTSVFKDPVPEVAVAADETIAPLLIHVSAAQKATRGQWGLKRGGSTTAVAVAKSTTSAGVMKRGTGRSVGRPRGSGRGGATPSLFGVGRGRGRGRGGGGRGRGGGGRRWLKKKNVDSDSSSGGGGSDSESNRDDGDNYKDDDYGLEKEFRRRETVVVGNADRFGDASVVAAEVCAVVTAGDDVESKKAPVNTLDEAVMTEEQEKRDEMEQKSLVSPKLAPIKKKRGSTAVPTKTALSPREVTPFSSARVSLNTYSKVDVWETNIGGIGVMRRAGDGWFNATHLLKIAGFIEKAKRTKMLERLVSAEVFPGSAVSSGSAGTEAAAGGEKTYEKIQGGYGRYQGTWVPADRALELAEEYGILERVQPLFDCSTSSDKPSKTFTSQNLES